MRPSRAGGRVGDLWISIEALPRHKAKLTLLKRCLVVSVSRTAPDRRRIDRPITWIVEMKSSAKPPRVSATRGTQDRPARQYWRSTWTSRAAGRPLDQLGRRTSAGRALDSAIRPGVSMEGPRAADSVRAQDLQSYTVHWLYKLYCTALALFIAWWVWSIVYVLVEH